MTPNENEARELLISAFRSSGHKLEGCAVELESHGPDCYDSAAISAISEALSSRDSEKRRADEAEAELARVREASQWRPIESCTAKRGEMIIAYRPLAHKSGDEPVAVKHYVGGNNHCWESTVPDGADACNPTDGSCHVTHWLPIPTPPERA